MVICLGRGADLPLMPLLLTVSCFSKIRIGFTLLVPAHPGSPEQRAIKRVLSLLLFLCEFHYSHGEAMCLIQTHLLAASSLCIR